METMVALLRGINVGGKNRLPMQDFRELLGELGCADVRTYIQSGNAVFRSDSDTTSLSRDISAAMRASFGFGPEVLVLTAKKFESIVAGNPYPEQFTEPRFLFTWFLAEDATEADVERMRTLCTEKESFHLTSQALYLHAPDGSARSLLANSVEKLLGVAATARNWRTVCKIAGLVND